ncbi:MAG: bifunctional adenosylcobinamide kinase/adenosylcobinamide-phosphate guanylyltransferase [Dehalococcoidia bacterium]|nr:bifunctional adenosylcobinamide kinase/adenosylcobinamide-phosphate guanylyltransferase [Dehalococcoidia bacterium]
MFKTDNKIILLLGGARSGKSTLAQDLANMRGGKVLFCATAEALDDEMRSRIAAHKSSRPHDWDTLESPRNTAQSLKKTVNNYDTVIIDCITLLVSNCLDENMSFEQAEQASMGQINALIELIAQRQGNYILVTNEVGSGLVPDNKLGRVYRDILGQTNQRLAKCADEVYFMAAGLFLKMK